ncbi:MAG: LuxR C-terminal-related transcriptional regulator [Burkholderiaceae bacterium]
MGFDDHDAVARTATRDPRGLSSVADNLFGTLLDENDYGLLVMAPDARLELANTAGQQFLATGGSLVLVDGRVPPASVASWGKWRRALDLSARGGRRMVVFGVDATVPAVTLSGIMFDDDGAAARVLAIAGRASPREALSLHNYGSEHALTPTEQRVLAGLAAERSASEVAQQHGVSESTVRTQIQSVLAKTRAPTH